MKIPTGKLTGNEIDIFFNESIQYHLKMYFDTIASFEPLALYDNWSELVRCIDEIINLPKEISTQSEKQKFLNLSFDFFDKKNLPPFKNVFDNIEKLFDSKVAERFKSIALMSSAINKSFENHGIFDLQGGKLSLSGTKNSIDYFQSRRIYYLSTLSIIPKIAKGSKKLPLLDLLNQFQYTLDSCLVGITTAYHRLLINNCLVDYEEEFDGKKGKGNYDFTQLEDFYLNPQRLSLIDQLELRPDIVQVKGLLKKSASKVFSFSEVANTMTLMQSAFKKYKIQELDIFKDLNLFFCEIGANLIDDYKIVIDENAFIGLQKKYKNLDLVLDSSDYFKILNSIAPFQKSGSYYYSTVVLLSRYAYYTLSNSLMKNKSFQINSGFVFEDRISKILEDYGFIDTKITRINRKEFDVVTIKNKKIYNFQCKNNFYDIASVDYDYKLIGRLNRRLCSSYEKALEKEKKREKLLIDKIGLSDIEHFVISRFPVITRNEKIINFNKIEYWISNYAS